MNAKKSTGPTCRMLHINLIELGDWDRESVMRISNSQSAACNEIIDQVIQFVIRGGDCSMSAFGVPKQKFSRIIPHAWSRRPILRPQSAVDNSVSVSHSHLSYPEHATVQLGTPCQHLNKQRVGWVGIKSAISPISPICIAEVPPRGAGRAPVTDGESSE